MTTKLEEILKNCHTLKLNGEKISLPAYFLYLDRNEKPTAELDVTKTFRITASKVRKTDMHVIEPFYKSVL